MHAERRLCCTSNHNELILDQELQFSLEYFLKEIGFFVSMFQLIVKIS